MSFSFGNLFGPRATDPEGSRLLGLSLESGAPIFAPPRRSTCVYAPSGFGKSISVAMPALMSFIASGDGVAILVSDPKDGELAAQAIPMLARLGFKVGLIDDLGVRPELAQYRIELNAFGASVAAFKREPRDLLYATETEAHALIEEPAEKDRNFYFRESPRSLIQFGQSATLKRDPAAATPGAASALVSDTDLLMAIAETEAEEGDPALQAQARRVLGHRQSEHFAMHVSEATRSLRQWGPGSRLEEAGRKATLTHENLIREGYIVFLVGPQSLMSKLGPYYALHLGSFTQALYQNIGGLRVIADEYTNSPLKSFLGEAITTARAFQGEFHLIAQSRSEVLRKYGGHLTETIEDQCIVTQWLGFGLKEAERVSRAMGEENAISTSLSGDSAGIKSQTSLSLIKQRVLTPVELMSLPSGIQLIHVKGVGFFLARTITQANIAPYAAMLAPNPLEGGRLKSDPKIRLATPQKRGGWL